MDRRNLFPTLVAGFGAAVLTTVPGIKNFACCLIVPLAVIVALYLDLKINKAILPVTVKTALIFGFFTALFATIFSTFFDVLITFITHSNDFIEALPQTESMVRQYHLGYLLGQTLALLKQMANQIKLDGFSLLYTFGILFSNFVIYTIFGLLGGLLGMTFINRRTQI